MLTWGYWPSQEGGSERQCRKIVKELAGKDIEFVVLTSRFALHVPSVENILGGQLVRLGALAPIETVLHGYLLRLFSTFIHYVNPKAQYEAHMRAVHFWLILPVVWCSRLMFILALRRWFVKQSQYIDIIHVHEAGWLAGVAAWLGKRFRIPVLAKTATHPALPEIGYDVPLRGLWSRLRKGCHFVAQHEGLVSELIAQGINRKRIFLIPNGVELPSSTAKPQKFAPGLYVGNFTQGAHWKAFDVLLQAWSLVYRQCPGAQLNMVGGGDFSQWRRFARKLECQDSVCFLGRVADPSPLYEGSCFFVLPSRVEGLSNALLEAQSFGLPCVVSNIPGNLAVVQDGVNGLVVPVDDPESLAKAIMRLIDNPDLRVKLGDGARQRAVASFSLQSVAESVASLYRSVVAAKGTE
jgi:glycosyltransferase involved in cell wall biosynthesis